MLLDFATHAAVMGPFACYVAPTKKVLSYVQSYSPCGRHLLRSENLGAVYSLCPVSDTGTTSFAYCYRATSDY